MVYSILFGFILAYGEHIEFYMGHVEHLRQPKEIVDLWKMPNLASSHFNRCEVPTCI
jgi:hypothetical protein